MMNFPASELAGVLGEGKGKGGTELKDIINA
jgi:hypothetical protein